MRILFFIQDLGAGGVLRQLDVLASGLTDRGHTVSVAALYTKSADWTDVWNAGSPPFRTIFDYKTYADIPGPMTLLKAVSGLKRIIATERPDVLYSFAGIDTERFKPDSEARDSLRREWGIKGEETLIGAAGRIVPEKGLDHFIKAASAVKKARPRIRVVIAGDGDPEYKRKLDAICAGSGLGGGLVWAGARKDMSRFYNSLDLFCSPSHGEGFPNVVAEAMACGVPCVATDAGDSASIIDGLGVVVPADNADELARGLMQALSRLPDFDPAGLRHSIVSKYSTGRMTASTEAALSELLGR